MRVVIPSKGRPETISTHLHFKDHYIFVHTDKEADQYLKNKTINHKRLIVTGEDLYNSRQRNWILKNFCNKNEWVIMSDDNVRGFTGVEKSYYKYSVLNTTEEGRPWRKIYNTPLDDKTLLRRLEHDVSVCERTGAHLYGVSITDNHYFRGKKYRQVGMVKLKFIMIKNSGILFDPELFAKVDQEVTGAHLLKYGRVLLNNFILPIAKHFQKGGIGTFKSRVKEMKRGSKYTMHKYPGLFRYNDRKNSEPGAELQLRFHSLKQIKEWRTNFLKGAVS